MSGFVKVDSGIVRSSLWPERDLRTVFLTALFIAEPFELEQPTPQLEVRSLKHTGWDVPAGWYGLVAASGRNLVALDGVDMEIGLAKLEELGSPDPDSRSNAFEGRRLVRIDGGYIVLNYDDYRQRDYGSAERSRRYRERQKALTEDTPTDTRDGDASDGASRVTRRDRTQAEAEAEAKAEADTTSSTTTTTPAHARIELIMQTLGVPPTQETQWAALLNGMAQGLGTPGMKPVNGDQLLEAAQEVAAAGGDVTPSRFKAFLAKVLARDYSAEQGGAVTRKVPGHTLAAAELLARVRRAANVFNPVNGSQGFPSGWKDTFTATELRVIDAITTRRILTDANEGTLVAQVARVVGEVGT